AKIYRFAFDVSANDISDPNASIAVKPVDASEAPRPGDRVFIYTKGQWAVRLVSQVQNSAGQFVNVSFDSLPANELDAWNAPSETPGIKPQFNANNSSHDVLAAFPLNTTAFHVVHTVTYDIALKDGKKYFRRTQDGTDERFLGSMDK